MRGLPIVSAIYDGLPLGCTLAESGYECGVELAEFIRMIDGAVRHECPAANVRLIDHSSAVWSCSPYNVSLQFADDAFRITIDHEGTVIYRNFDLRDKESPQATARLIAKALQGAPA